MPPKPRPFFPENTPDTSIEAANEMDQAPETTMSPEQEYIEAQIRLQVQSQVQAQMQAYIQSQSLAQAQAQIQNQAQNLVPPLSQNPFQLTQSSLTDSIKLPDAAKFDGKVSEYNAFISSMEMFFWGSPDTFAADKNKILFIGSHLQGTASTWFRSLLASNSPCLVDFELFMNEFRNNFSDPSHSIKVRGQIRNCKQGSRSASAYAAEFRALARESGFDKVALVDQFLRGLNQKIMQYLIVMDIPESLEENIQLAVRIDNRLCTMNLIYDNKSDVPSLNPFRSKNNHSFSSTTTSNSQHQEPTVYMEIDAMTSRPRGPLSEKEKARRYELGLCLYCGGSGHIALDCTKRKFPGKARTQQ
ncbi:Retrotransposon-derived protein PEG10 [Smittium culicis]|uniref:Retrotransposon-derived protein PEG10 n=1 Tax=Smittium culicis TaxID=133412 RepID=A0A1R1XA21_9FUNG|nr:Retrotransposon-derived protein PEG10 [Smittium culicis]